MATALTFGTEVDAWVLKTTQRVEGVFKESAKRTVTLMQTPVGAGGNMPVDVGYLRASIRASTEAAPQIDPGSRPTPGMIYSYDGGDVTAVITNAKLGQSIFVGYTASYAAHVEYGARGRAPRAFVGLAAAQWPATVNQVAADLKDRAV